MDVGVADGVVRVLSSCWEVVEERHRRCCNGIRFDRAHEHDCCLELALSTRRRDREGACIDDDIAWIRCRECQVR